MSSGTSKGDKLSLTTSVQPCRRFSLAEIQSATRYFDDELVIGKGGFGKVYKGSICIEETSHVVAIKRLDSISEQGAPEFKAEIEMLSKLRHCHLVSLIGYCDDNDEMILVYAYLHNGTLYHHLHNAKTPLSWMQRLKIAIGAARGLDYLHTGVGTKHGVIHRDVKSSNILLDENMDAMISDFGMSKIGPTNQSSSYVDASVKGTFGYLDPEYFYTRKLTRKTDVYAFGVVLFELLSGRLAVDELNGDDHCSLVRWAQRCVKERKLDQLVDSNIRGTIFPKCLRGFVKISDRCLRSVLKERPTMFEVVVSLQSIVEQQQRHDNPAESGITGFTWKIHKYIVSATKQQPEQSGISSTKRLENNMNQCSLTNKEDSNQGEVPRQQGKVVFKDLRCFTYYELRRATKNFENGKCFGNKSYVSVYKGWIKRTTSSPSDTKLAVAIKSIDIKFYKLTLRLDLKEFSHPNLEKLIGYCLKGQPVKKILLVYEFLPKGNFEDILFTGYVIQLPLTTKVKIAAGIARGIVFLHKTQDQDGFSESRLDRHSILLDEDFTAKLSGYDVTKLVYGRYHRSIQPSKRLESADYGGWVDISLLQSNLSGFTIVFTEVLTGKHISNEDNLKELDDLFIQHLNMSLVDIAKSCFEICNEVDSESKMLRILEEYEYSRISDEKFRKALCRAIHYTHV